jgi:hypothetical protein
VRNDGLTPQAAGVGAAAAVVLIGAALVTSDQTGSPRGQSAADEAGDEDDGVDYDDELP